MVTIGIMVYIPYGVMQDLSHQKAGHRFLCGFGDCGSQGLL